MRILVLEDDLRTADYIAAGLREQGHTVDHLSDGRTGLVRAASESYDVMVVDRMLPGLDGLSLVKTLRGAAIFTPVLFLTALDGVDERVTGLNAGGDDYLTKPFAFSELSARVIALTRRGGRTAPQTRLKVGDLELDLLTHTARRAGREIALQPREFKLLEYLMRNTGQVVTRTMLLENVWEFHFDPQSSVVETHISRLRAKIDDGGEMQLIQTIRGVGYRIYAPA
jgi:two-component system OmpR family response regulator